MLEVLDAISGPVLPTGNKEKLLEALGKHFDERITVLLYSYIEELETQVRPRAAAIQAPQRHNYFMSELNFYFALLVLASQALICIADSVEDSSGAVARFNTGVYGILVIVQTWLCASGEPRKFLYCSTLRLREIGIKLKKDFLAFGIVVLLLGRRTYWVCEQLRYTLQTSATGMLLSSLCLA